MGTGYVRNDTGNNIADGNVINASDLDGEFDAVQAAFNASTGHSHDGTTGEGPQITTAGLADDAVTGAKIDSTTTVTAASFVGPLTGNASTASTLASSRTITLNGDVSGSVAFNGGSNVTITTAVADDSHNHVVGNIDNFTESVQDIAGAMFSGNTESGISAVYQDGDGTIDLNVNDPTISLTGAVTGSATMTNLGNVSIATTATSDPTITLSGDASGSATLTNLGNATLAVTLTKDPTVTLTGAVTGSGTMTNLGNVSIATTATADPTLTLNGDVSGSATFTNLGNATLTATVANDSHTHDTRYFTETESDSRFVRTGANSSMSGTLDVNNTLTAYRGIGDTETASKTGTVTPDMSRYTNFVWTLTGNITLGNPGDEATGQSGVFVFIHSGAARTVSLSSDWETAGAAGLTLSGASGAVDIVPYFVQAGGNILLGTPQLAFS